MSKKPMYILMCALVVIWGLDFVVAKTALEMLEPMILLFYKLLTSIALVLTIRLITEKGPLLRKKDIGLLIVCVIFGDIIYFFAEYTAMDYMPLSLISIVLAFIPVLSLLTERIVFKKRAPRKAVMGVVICIVGVALIIGVDWQILLQGRLIGYLFAFAAVFGWNVYNFMTEALHERYSTVSLTLNQSICACLILLPYALHSSPPLASFNSELILGILYLGLASSGVGFLILVRSLHVLGPTTVALFSNFLPITTTIFGWLIYGETIAPLQFVGGAIVIIAGYIVIKETGKKQTLQTQEPIDIIKK